MGFVRKVLFTYLVRLLLIPLGLLSSVIVARWLGPAGQGIFATLSAYVATAGMLGSLGLSPAITRAVAADRERAGAMLANARVLGLATGAACIAGLLLVWVALPGAFDGVPAWLLLLAASALPFNLTASQFQAVLVGLDRVRQYNLVDALERGLLLASAVTLLVILDLGVAELVAGTTVIAAVKLATYHVQLGPLARRMRPDLALMGSLRGISSRAYVASLLAFLVLRSDIMLVHGMLGARHTGVYSIAVQITTLMLVLPSAIGTLLVPRIAATGMAEGAAFTARLCRHAVPLVTLGCVAIGAAGSWLVANLYGPEYLGAVICIWILLPGVWCMSLQLILAHDLAGRDYPAFLTAVWLVLLAVNVGLNLVWIPRHGIAGAATSSSVAYTLALLLVARYWLRRFPEIRLRQLLMLDAGELRSLPGRLRQGLFPSVRRDGQAAR